MRTAFVGAVEGSHRALAALGRTGFAPDLVVTLPLDRAARHSDFADLRPLAGDLGCPVLDAANVNAPDVLAALRELDLDHVLVLGWSQICGPEFLGVPRHGVIGYHPAPLPENRGRGVIPWTIVQRRTSTAGTLFWLDEGMDSGDLLDQEAFDVAQDETARSLYEKHLAALERMLERSMPRLARADAPRVPQDHSNATYCARRTAADGHIDWTAPAEIVWTLVRAAGEPYPGAFTFHKGARAIVWEADLVGAAPFWGFPGQIQAIDEDGSVVVQCGDRHHVRLRTVAMEDGARVAPASVMKNHERLGIDWLGVHTATQAAR